MNRGQIRFLNSKSTDLDWYYSKYFWKLKKLIRDLLFTTFVKKPPEDEVQLGRVGVKSSQLSAKPKRDYGEMASGGKHRSHLHNKDRGFLRFSLSQPLPQPPPVVKIFPKLFISLVTILPF